MKLWIGNIAPGTSDDEIRELVKKYAPNVECGSIERVDGDGSRPAAMIEFGGPVETIVSRLHGMYWKERKLNVQAMTR
jgi:RNA recognition motif-containing protein